MGKNLQRLSFLAICFYLLVSQSVSGQCTDIMPDGPFCEGDEITFTATCGNTTTDWEYDTGGGVTTFTGETLTLTMSADITISVGDAGDGSTSHTENYTVNPLPNDGLAVDAPDACPGGMAQVEISNSESGVSYQLIANDVPFESPVTSTGEDPLIISFNTPAMQTTYFVEATTPEGCVDTLTDTGIVSLYNSPTASFSVDDSEVCLNDPQPTITFTGADGNNPYLFSYTINDGPVQTLDSSPGNNNEEDLDVPTNVAGIFEYEITQIEDENGCITTYAADELTLTVTVHELPDVTMPTTNETEEYCVGNDAPDISFELSGSSPYSVTYTIDGGSSTTVTNAISPFVIAGAGPGEYVITDVTDMNGCTTPPGFMSNSITVVEFSAPDVTVPSMDITEEYCEGETAPDISFEFSGSSPFSIVYTIDGSSPTTVNNTMSPFTIVGAAPGEYVITSIADVNGCVTGAGYMSNSITVIENPLPDITLDVNGVDICAGETDAVIQIANSESGVSYQVQEGGIDVGSPVTSSGENPLEITISAPASETTYTVEATTAEGCIASLADDGIVSIFDNPEVTIPNSDITENYCEGDDLPDIVFALSGTGPFDVTYTFDGAPISLSGVSSPITIFDAAAGEYIVTSILDANGCMTDPSYMSNSITVVQNDAPEVTMPAANETLEYCSADTGPDVTFEISGASPFSVTYTVDGINPTVVTNVTSPFTLADPGPGVYVITSITDMDACSTAGGYMSSSITVVENLSPMPMIMVSPQQTEFCEDETFILSITGLPGATGDYSYDWELDGSQVSTTELVTVMNAMESDEGTYALTVTDMASMCTGTAEVAIVINPLPDAMIDVAETSGASSNDGIICNEDDVVLTASGGVMYEWNEGLGTNPVQAISPSSTTTYIVTVTDSEGCESTAETTITVNDLPTLDIDTEGVMCSADLSTYSVPFTSNGTVTSDFGTVSGNMVVGIDTMNNVTITATSSENCIVSTLVVAPNCLCPDIEGATNTSTDQDACFGSQNPELSVSVPSGLNVNWYLEEPSDGTPISMVNTLTPDVTAVGEYTYYVETVDPVSGCVSIPRLEIEFEIYALPSVNLAAAGPFCVDADPVDLTGLPSGGTFSGDGITNSSSGTFDPTIAGVGTTTITYTYIDENGCENDDMIDIVVNDLPDVSITDPGEFCVTDPATQLMGDPSGGIFTGDGITNSAGAFDPSVVGVGTATVTYTFLDGNNCENSTTIDIEINPLAEFSVVDQVCSEDLLTYTIIFNSNASTVLSDFGTVVGNEIQNIPANQDVIVTITSIDNCVFTQSVIAEDCECEEIAKPMPDMNPVAICFGDNNPVLSVTVENGLSANWYLEGSSTPLPMGENTLTYVPTFTDPGIYNYVVFSYDPVSDCQGDSDTLVFIINALPEPQITPEGGEICANGTLTLGLTELYAEYLWTDNSTNATLEVTEAGNYGVIVTDDNGCSEADQVTVTVIDLPEVIDPVIDEEVTYCEGLDVPDITFQISGSGPFEVGYTIDGGNVITENISGNILTIVDPAPGVYEVVSITNTTNNCSTDDGYTSNSIEVVELESPSFTIVKTPIAADLVCNGESFTLSVDIEAGNYTYLWETPLGTFNTDEITFNDASSANEGTYTCTVTNEDTGCESTVSQEIVLSVVEGSVSSSNADNEVCIGSSINLIAEGFSGDVTWLNEELEDVQNDALVTVSPTETTVYEAILSNNFGCEIEVSIEIIVNPLPTPVIETANPYCEDAEVTLSTTESYVSYEWNDGSEESTLTFDADIDETVFSVEVVDENGCIGSDEVMIDVKMRPETGISTPVEIVEALTEVEFSVVQPTSDPDCPIVEYQWFVEGIGIETYQEPQIFNYTFSDEGFFDVCLFILDDCGCLSEAACITMDVAPNGSCSISFPAQENFCAGECSALVANPIPGETATVPIDGHFIIDGIEINNGITLGAPITGVSGLEFTVKDTFFKTDAVFLDSIIVEFSEPGNYPYQFFVNYSNACIRTSGVRSARVQTIPTFEEIIIDTEACFGEKPRIEFELPDGQEDFQLNYTIDGVNQTKDFFGSNNFIEINPPSNMADSVEVQFNIIVNYNPVDQTGFPSGCSTEFDEDPFKIYFLDSISYALTDSCNTDLTEVTYEIELSGGTGMYSINDQDLMGVDTFVSDPPVPSGSVTFFNIVDEGCEDDYPPIILQANTECLTCISFTELAQEIDLDVDITRFACESDTIKLELLQSNGEPAELNLPSGANVIYVVQEASNVLYKENNIILTEIADVTNPTSFSFTIDDASEFVAGETYFVSAYIFPEQGGVFLADSTCNGLSNQPISFLAEPDTELNNLEDDIICSNEFDFQVSFDIDNVTINEFFSSDEENTNVFYIEGDTIALISFDTLTSNQLLLTLQQTAVYNNSEGLFNCVNQDDLVLTIHDGFSPPKDSIIQWPGYLYAYTGDSEEYCYQWGIDEDIIAGEDTRFYIAGEPLEDGEILWIDVWDCDETLCTSRIYFNSFGPPQLVTPDKEIEYLLYPNPNDGQFTLELNGSEEGEFVVMVYNTTGEFISSKSFIKENVNHKEQVSLHDFSAGLYILKVFNENGENEIIKVIKQ